jgi:8-oxo-dGTP diphosphatase
VEEESGLLVKKMWLKGFLSFPGFANDEDWYAFVFVIPDFEGQLIESAEGDLKWVDNSELLQLNLWEGDRIFLPWLDRSGIFSGKFVYKDGSLVEHSVSFYE